jgi:hypothetical protein
MPKNLKSGDARFEPASSDHRPTEPVSGGRAAVDGRVRRHRLNKGNA